MFETRKKLGELSLDALVASIDAITKKGYANQVIASAKECDIDEKGTIEILNNMYFNLIAG